MKRVALGRFSDSQRHDVDSITQSSKGVSPLDSQTCSTTAHPERVSRSSIAPTTSSPSALFSKSRCRIDPAVSRCRWTSSTSLPSARPSLNIGLTYSSPARLINEEDLARLGISRCDVEWSCESGRADVLVRRLSPARHAAAVMPGGVSIRSMIPPGIEVRCCV